MPHSGYLTTGTAKTAELWSDTRLPFEPRGASRQARQEIRTRLRHLVATPGEILCADYVSEDNSFCDVENVLFYNVGRSTFRAATKNGLAFRRLHAKPPPSPTGRAYRHFQRYALIPIAATAIAGRRICSIAFELERLSSSTKPHEVWWPIMHRGAATYARVLDGGCPFGLRLRLEVPRAPSNIADLVKTAPGSDHLRPPLPERP